MAGPFEAATRAAIEELIQSHGKASKFGYVLTHENARELTDAIFQLLLTSRNLKSAGDRLMAGGTIQTAPSSTGSRQAAGRPSGKTSPSTTEIPQGNRTFDAENDRQLPPGVTFYKSRNRLS